MAYQANIGFSDIHVLDQPLRSPGKSRMQENVTRSSRRAALFRIWQQNQDLLRNAGSLAATTGLTSLFGFVYWIIAAREFTQQAVGYGSAEISMMILLGTVGMFGFGTMLIGELPNRRSKGGLISASLLASALGSLILGLGFPLIALASGAHFEEITGTPDRILLFAVGVAITGMTSVFDEATIGLMRGGVQLTRNLAMSIAKLVLLPASALLLHDAFGVGIMLAWVLGTIISLLPTAIQLKRGGASILHRPEWRALRRLGKVTLAHNWLNLAIATPPRLLPVFVTVVVSPSANAAFYIAWMLASFLFMIPAHLSTVLFAIASATPDLISEKLRFVLRLSLMIGLPIMLVLGVGAHLVLGIFGANYARLATIPLWLLILEYIPDIPKAQYIAVCRATGKVAKAAVILTIAAVCELIAVVIGGKLGGLNGLCLAHFCVVVVEGLITAPAVIRTAYARGLRRATGPFASSITGTSESMAYVDRQQAGLAALIALATTAVSQAHALDAATEVWRVGLASPSPAPGRHRTADSGAIRIGRWGTNTTAPILDAIAYKRRQQAGVDALIALATPVVSEEYANGRSTEDRAEGIPTNGFHGTSREASSPGPTHKDGNWKHSNGPP
jgi:O-antigen/teichoic acid export membrane protein